SKRRAGWGWCAPLCQPRAVPCRLRRLAWVGSVAIHVAVVIWLVTASWRSDGRQGLSTISPPDMPLAHELPPFGGTRRGVGPSGGLGRPLPDARIPDTTPPEPAPVGRPDSMLAANPASVGP